MSDPANGEPSSNMTAAIDDGCRRALQASNYLQRSLHAWGLEAPGDPADRGRAMAWLGALATVTWTPDQLAARFVAILEGLALPHAASVAGALPTAARLGPVAAPSGRAEPATAAAAAQPADPVAVGRALRRLRRELICGLMLRDCAGIAPLEEVTLAMTAFAELSVQRLLAAIVPEMVARYGRPEDPAGEPQDLLVLAMGKAGGGELNVSSDLDLIFAYGESGRGDRPADGLPPPATDNQEFFDRLGRRLIGALGEPDADGFVFRVDMRLRPHGDAGPLVVSLAMLEEYLVREGREWERFAWAKARVISQPVMAGAASFARQVAMMDAVVQPFIYRKYFDFGAIGAIRDLHQRIRSESRRRAVGRPERALDVKIGRGGIREIEFLAQTFCIMRGGRDDRLRARGTVACLQTLGGSGLLARADAQALIGHYRFLRRLEHALQYRNDAQTHLIPPDEAERAAVATLLGIASGDAMVAQYRAVSADVERLFDRTFPAEPGRPAGDAPAAPALDAGGNPPGPPGPAEATPIDAPALALNGFEDPAGSAARLAQLMKSPRVMGMSAGARAAVEQLAGSAVRIIRALAQRLAPQGGASADEILLRWIRLVEVIGRRSTYLSLLAEYPQAHERVLGLLASGGWPSEYLLQHPILLDELIDVRAQRFADDRLADDPEAPPGSAEPYWAPWIAEVDEQLRRAVGDVERQMNILRDAHHAQVFRLLLADLAGNVHVERLGDHLSALADGVLALTLRAAWRSMDAVRAAPDTPAPRLAIIAYGKLGGRELGYVSDLDLTFVYDESKDPQQADRDASAATHLVRRVIAWLTTVTSSGTLFEIDVRLRPNGNAGLMVTPFEAFDRYESNADGRGAWVWEHQALTRARGCAGDAALCRRIERVRDRILSLPRDPQPLATEVVAMRQRMLDGHPNRSEGFDIKHDRGGMVDVEFIVQYLVLAHAHRHPVLLANRGNIGLLAIAAHLGLVPPQAATTVGAAYRRFRQLQHALRLNGAERARVAHALVQDEIAAVRDLWRTAFATDAPEAARTRRPSGPR